MKTVERKRTTLKKTALKRAALKKTALKRAAGKSVAMVLASACVFAFAACGAGGGQAQSGESATSTPTTVELSSETTPMELPTPLSGEITTDSITKYGNITISIAKQDFFDAGYKFGDVVTLSFLDHSVELPVGSNYSDVDTGEAILAARDEDNELKAAINMGDFATTYGIGVKTVLEDKTVVWNYPEGVEGPITCTVTIKEPGGYYGMYIAHQLSYTDERSDYPELTDEEFANFRSVNTTGIGKNRLFRSATPVNPEHNRNTYADKALKEHGVTVILNLADREDKLAEYQGYEESYYRTVSHVELSLGMDFHSEDFRKQLAEGLRLMANTQGVYAIHCLEGKDRTGIVCALLECLMGASLDEVEEDYMLSYTNYYGVKPEDDQYYVISHGNMFKNLQRLFGIEDLESADLAACAQEYLKNSGMTEEEIRNLKANLSA